MPVGIMEVADLWTRVLNLSVISTHTLLQSICQTTAKVSNSVHAYNCKVSCVKGCNSAPFLTFHHATKTEATSRLKGVVTIHTPLLYLAFT